MKPLIILFILCGKPDIFVGYDISGVFVGSLNHPNHPMVDRRAVELLRNKETLKRKIKTENFIGGRCA